MDLYSRTQDGCAPCFGPTYLMSAQILAGSGSAWYKHTAKAMDALSQGLSKAGRNLTTKQQRKELGEIGIDAAKQKANPTGAAIEQFDDLYLTGKGDCGKVASYPASPKKALKGKGTKKALEKAGAGAKKVAKKKPNRTRKRKRTWLRLLWVEQLLVGLLVRLLVDRWALRAALLQGRSAAQQELMLRGKCRPYLRI